MSEKAQVVLFIVLVLLTSWSYEAYIASHGGVAHFGLPGLLALMSIPGLLSLLMRLVMRSGIADVGFVIGKAKYYLYAVSMPLALALLTALLCTILDIRRFALIDADALDRVGPVLLSMGGFGLLGAFGEELGWRGFLLPKLVAGGISHPYAASGLVWASWHLPLIAFGGFYAADDIALIVPAYAISIFAINLVISELRMRSESIWVATLFHASHNFFFQLAIPTLILATPGKRSDLWNAVGGDSGVIVAVLYVLAFLFLSRLPVRSVSSISTRQEDLA